MAQGKTTTITKIKLNNAKVDTTIAAQSVEQVVIDGQLVPDPAKVNPGVVQ